MDNQEGAKKKFYTRWWFWLIILVLAIFGMNSANNAPPSVPSTEATTVQPAPSPSKDVELGNNGYLYIKGSDNVAVMRTQDAFDAYTKAAVNNDTIGMAQLVYDDQGFFVPDGTKVLVIDSGMGTREVRILEGKHIAETGWVALEFVLSAPPATTTAQ